MIDDPPAAPDLADELAALATLAADVIERCRARALHLTVAESCTGGLVGHLLTETAGSSDVFTGGAVTYSDALKERLLAVPAATLEHHGAVSAQVAVAMAEGARSRLGGDIALAVTGIAGPGGGSPAKPVGLTYVAVADAAGHDVRRHVWERDRSGNKRDSARAALQLLLERLAE
ncbi:MAG TPA: CinA family protein [Candidatus Limnocylindrales bacterium]|nr:CinA family protein [Candidatus Limnocylindrales bacterium]